MLHPQEVEHNSTLVKCEVCIVVYFQPVHYGKGENITWQRRNYIFRSVIVFLPKSKCLLITWMQSPSTVILEHKKIKYATISIFSPSIYHEVMGPHATILVFWMLSFKPTFSLSSFTFIKKFFGSSLLSAIRVVTSAYLRLLAFLLAILIPAFTTSNPAFRMMYSA